MDDDVLLLTDPIDTPDESAPEESGWFALTEAGREYLGCANA